MSRIGKMPIAIHEKTQVNINENLIDFKGPLGDLSFKFSKDINVKKENDFLIVSPIKADSKAIWGTTRSILNNMMIGVSKGYTKQLEINGVGYKFEIVGNNTLSLSIGYSHKVNLETPDGIKISLGEKNKNLLTISGIDKQLVGEFASKVRSQKKPEPYKGKGIKYFGEHIKRKAGKTGSK